MGSADCSFFCCLWSSPTALPSCVPRVPLPSLSSQTEPVDYEQIAGRLSTLQLGSLIWQPSELKILEMRTLAQLMQYDQERRGEEGQYVYANRLESRSMREYLTDWGYFARSSGCGRSQSSQGFFTDNNTPTYSHPSVLHRLASTARHALFDVPKFVSMAVHGRRNKKGG